MPERVTTSAAAQSPHRLRKLAGSSAVLLCAVVASCAGPESSPPQQVQANNPTVTYNYRGDEELIKASQSAGVYCSKYQSSAQVKSITDTSDGGKAAVFECVSSRGPAVPGQAFTQGLPYSYASDQELMDRTRNADAYCTSIGSQHAISTISTGTNGSKAVTFNCSSP